MKILKSLILLIIGGFLFYQSGSAQPKRSRVYVTVRPAAPVIVRPVAPHKKAIWIPGEWVWRNNRYVHVNGYYANVKPGYRRYTEGHWKKVRGGHVWVAGRWIR